jgi:hypothetical protein
MADPADARAESDGEDAPLYITEALLERATGLKGARPGRARRGGRFFTASCNAGPRRLATATSLALLRRRGGGAAALSRGQSQHGASSSQNYRAAGGNGSGSGEQAIRALENLQLVPSLTALNLSYHALRSLHGLEVRHARARRMASPVRTGRCRHGAARGFAGAS